MKEYEVEKKIELIYLVEADSKEEAEEIVNKLGEKDARNKHTYGAEVVWCSEAIKR